MYVNTPPMGWNSWNTFGTNINEQLILDMADVIIDKGLAELGYNYVVIDDCWSLHERDENGKLVADPEKFPHGMKWLADRIHEKGLKFGMYSCCGVLTCAGYPGSFDHEFTDAATFAEWGVDFLKYDNCFAEVAEPIENRYRRMSLALANSGRDILFSACSWGAENTRNWIKATGAHMWRSTGDISDNFNSIRDIIRQEIRTMQFNGRGCFNDIDMLVVGMNGKGNVGFGGCTYEEYVLHFAFWCFFGSPLMIGCDLRAISDECLALLKNKDLLRINQDKAYSQPFFVKQLQKNPDPNSCFLYEPFPQDHFCLARQLDDGKFAIGFFNIGDEPTSAHLDYITLYNLGIPETSGKTLRLRNVMTGEETLAERGIIYIGEFKPHTCYVYIATVVDK